MKKLLNIVMLCFGMAHVISVFGQLEPVAITYPLTQGLGDSINIDGFVEGAVSSVMVEPLQVRSIQAYSYITDTLSGLYTNGWPVGDAVDTTHCVLVNIKVMNGQTFFLDSVKIMGTGFSYVGPMVAGAYYYTDNNTEPAAYEVGWQVGPFSYAYGSPMGWWMLHTNGSLQIRIVAWDSYDAPTGWVINNIHIYGHVDSSTSIADAELAVPVENGSVIVPTEWSGGVVTVCNTLGQVVMTPRAIHAGETLVSLPRNTTLIVSLSKDGTRRSKPFSIIE